MARKETRFTIDNKDGAQALKTATECAVAPVENHTGWAA